MTSTTEASMILHRGILTLIGLVIGNAAIAAKPTEPHACAPGGEPIVLGDLSSLSGALRFPEAQEAAALVFKAANAECGVHGRPIRYLVVDDAGHTDKAAQLARELVLDRQAVALIGGASAVNCTVNAEFYQQVPIAIVPGTGTAPDCFTTVNIAPPNGGVFTMVTLALKFAATYLAPRRLCLVGNAHPWIPGNFRDPVEHAERLTGTKITIVNQELHPDERPDPVLTQVQDAHCDVVFLGTQRPFAAKFVGRLQATGDSALQLVIAGEAYDDSFVAGIDPILNRRIYVTSEYDFLDSEQPGMTRMRRQYQEAGLHLNSFAVGGHVAANVILAVLRGIEGSIDRGTVLAALNDMPSFDTGGLTATPYTFRRDAGSRWAPGIRVATVMNRKWVHATEDWIVLRPER